MEIEVGGSGRVRIVVGDIVRVGTEAIVNAANERLAGGGGVDGAIHAAAGSELYELTRPMGGCPTGSAVITGAGQIKPPTRFIIHAVGPRYSSKRDDECAALLASAHRTSLRLAEENKVKSIAFPAISTGVYGYPVDKAAPIAINEAIDHFGPAGPPPAERSINLVVFVLFTPRDYAVYERVLSAYRAG